MKLYKKTIYGLYFITASHALPLSRLRQRRISRDTTCTPAKCKETQCWQWYETKAHHRQIFTLQGIWPHSFSRPPTERHRISSVPRLASRHRREKKKKKWTFSNSQRGTKSQPHSVSLSLISFILEGNYGPLVNHLICPCVNLAVYTVICFGGRTNAINWQPIQLKSLFPDRNATSTF